FGAAALRRDAPARLFWADHPDWTFEHDEVVEALAGAGLKVVRTHEDLHAYPLEPGVIDLERVGRELSIDVAWLRELASLTRGWSSLYELARASFRRPAMTSMRSIFVKTASTRRSSSVMMATSPRAKTSESFEASSWRLMVETRRSITSARGVSMSRPSTRKRNKSVSVMIPLRRPSATQGICEMP